MDLKTAFPLGQKVDVFVTHVDAESGNCFVQMNNEQAGKLDDLMAEIESFISSEGSQFLTEGEIRVGMIYLAQYSEDARWYRARVEAVKSGHCEVFFIDYGNVEQIPVKFLRNSQPSFLRLRPQAFECVLVGIEKFRGPNFQEAVSTFKGLVLEQELSCVTSSINDGVLIVNLFKDVNCQDSILTHLLSRVQRIPQFTTMDSHEPPQNKGKKSFKTISLSNTDYKDVCVTDVEDPLSFSCQFIDGSEALLDMMDEIANEYEDLKQGDLQLQSSSVGYPCCAKFAEDACWYRAVITKSSSVASGFLDVKFVDYGNVQTTPVSDVKELKNKFLELPLQSIECALYGIRPENNSTEWSSDAKTLFTKLTKNKHIVVQVQERHADGKYLVKLVDTTGEMDMQVDQILIAAKYAEKDSNGLKNALSPLISQGGLPSSKQASPQVQSNEKHQDTKRKALFPYTKEFLAPGKEEKVLVSSVTSPSLFYCMLYRTSIKLEKLMSDIRRHYSQLGPEEEWLTNPSVGDPCCAKFSEDQSWYRALVTDVSSSGKVEVLFIDYGNSERVPPNSVKKLAPQFSELPSQGIKCTLNRICPKGSKDWKRIDLKTFEELALECTGKLTVIALEDELHRVELVVFEKGKEINLAEALLLKGNAILVEGAFSQSENLANVSSKKFTKVAVNAEYEDVFVSHIEDPANFWCQLTKHQDDLNNVMSSIHDYCTRSSDVIRNPSLGLACCAKYSEDQAWYRATITGIKKNNEVEVQFVDYGNYDNISLSDLRVIKPEFMELPAQALKCRLEQLDSSTLITFPPEAIDKFYELTLDKELVLMIGSFDKNNEQYLTLLLCGTEDLFDTIAPLMPEVSRKEIVVPKQEVKPGRREEVCVTTVNGMSDFFCQFMCSATSLDEMMISMDAHYKALAPEQEQLSQPKVGCYCVGQYTEDNSWYRAKIVGKNRDMFEVVYIDFGNGETLPASRIKKLSQSFSQLPQPGVFCSLAGNNSLFSDSQFIELTLDKMFDMEIVSVEKDEKAKVELYCADTKRPLREQLTKQQSESSVEIQPNPLKVGTTEVAFVALASSISKFYCQLSKTADSLVQVMEKMYSYYDNLEGTEDAVSGPQVGAFCSAKFSEDDGWYRAVVSAVHDNSVEVFYVDYGNSEVLPLDRVKKLKPEFAELPIQAIQCRLNNSKGLTSEACARFMELVSDPEVKYEVTIISMASEGVFNVELINKETGESVSEILVNKGLTQDESSQSKMESVSLSVGEIQGGQCSYAASPSQFWFNLNSGADTLNNLLEDMAVFYECLSPSDCILSSPTVGAYCCGQYSLDQGWYRAKITAVQGSQVDLHFVDFGNSERKSSSSLKELKEEFQALPEQAILCSLHQAIPADNSTTWSEDALKQFSDLVVEKDAIIKVNQKLPNNCHVVELLDSTGSKDLALGTLIEKDLAANPNKTSDYRPFTVTPSEGGFIDVNPLICHSPHDFYCQVLSINNIKAFGQLTSDLQDVYSKMGPNDSNLVKPEVGMPCCAVYSGDGSWNRGKIFEIIDGSTLKVFFVDYGNQELLGMNKVKLLLPEFTDLPMQCVQCCLSSIRPINEAQWSDKAKERFADLVVHQQLVAKLINQGEGKTMEVLLFDTHDDTQDINIGEILVNENLAAWVTSSSPTEERPKLAMKTVASLESLKVTSGDVLYITAVDSPEIMYCQLAGTEEKLENLMANLTAFYESPKARELGVQSASVGQVCAALFSEDNNWYRAVVSEVSPVNITVRFIDYGNMETLSLNNVRILAEQFTKEPVLTIKCKLSGVQPPGGTTSWPKDATEFLGNVEGDDGFKVIVISSGEVLEVKLCDQQGDLSERLITEGLAITSQQESTKPAKKAKQSSPKPSSKILNFNSPDIQVGKKMEVYVTDVTSPGQFCCQLAEYGDKLNQMMDSIYDHYSKLDDTAGCLVSPDIGQPCVAVFEGDGSWYRAVVQSMTLKDLNVKFVDYGNSQTVKPFEVKQIIPRFMELPKLAIECTIDSQKSDWTKEEIKKFTALLGEDIRTAEIVKDENGRYLAKIYQGSECITDSFLRKPAKPEIPNHVLQPNQVEDVYVVYLFNSTRLCLQLSKHSNALDEVMATIDQSCQSNETPLRQDAIQVGTPCCALFEDLWYRAVVISRPSSGHVDVHYIDYGNNATVPLSDVRSLPESCLQFPKQAISCTLNYPDILAVSKEMVENALMDKLLEAKFLKFEDEHWSVVLKTDGVDVAESLLKDAQTTTLTPKAKIFTEQNLSENSNAEVYVSHTFTPNEFYLQLSSSTDTLNSLTTRLNAVYSGPGQSPLQKLELGSICCAQYLEDNSWYRSIITALPDDKCVEVQFVDYGNSDVVERSKVMDLEDEFVDIPVLAIKCSLESQGVQWTDEDSEKFEVLVYDEELDGMFIQRSEDKWQVRLHKDGTALVKLLNESKKEEALPVASEPQIVTSIKDKEVTVGMELECGLSHVGDAGSFYVQLNIEPLLDKVTDMISRIYPSLGPTEECLKEYKVGAFCCVQFSEDEQWYRAIITEVLPESQAKVMFIDFGNSEVTTVSSTKCLRPEFYEIPKLAIPCRLANTKDNWTEADTVLLEEKMLEKMLKVKFVSATENGWIVVVDLDGTRLNTLPEFTLSEQPNSLSFTKASLSNMKEPVIFLMAESLDSIWVQPKRTENDLSALMNEIAESKPTQTMAVSEMSNGMPCLAKFTEDDEWYRAEVIECKEQQLLVQYVDYGNSELVDSSRISTISSSFLQLPIQAVEFSLSDIPESSRDIVLKKMNEEYPEITLEAEILSKNDSGVYHVKLFDQDGRDLVQNLIDATERESDFVATKEPVSLVEYSSVVSKEAEVVESSGIEGKVEETNESEKEEFFEAQEQVNGNEASRGSSDSLAETTLPPLASETPSNDDSPSSNNPDTALQDLEVLNPESAIKGLEENVLTAMQEKGKEGAKGNGISSAISLDTVDVQTCSEVNYSHQARVDRTSDRLKENQPKLSTHFTDVLSRFSNCVPECEEQPLSHKATKCGKVEYKEELAPESTKNVGVECQEYSQSDEPNFEVAECQDDFSSRAPKDVAVKFDVQQNVTQEFQPKCEPECQEYLPCETSKDVTPKGQEDLPNEAYVTPEGQEHLSSETPKNVTPECQDDLPFEITKDVTLEYQDDLPSEVLNNGTPECQKDLLSETPKDVTPGGQENVPPKTPKDVTTEFQEDLSSEVSKDVTPECQEYLPSGTPKNVTPEGKEDLPPETSNDVTLECQKDLPPETSKDVTPEGQKDLSSETANNVTPEGQKDLSSETPECQEDLSSETAKDVTAEYQGDLPPETPECQEDLSSETAKDVTPEYQEDLPPETAKGMTPECQEDLSSETSKDVTPEDKEDLSSETPKEVMSECQEDLPHKIVKDVTPEGQEDLSSETPKDVTCQEELSSETPKDVTSGGQENVPSVTTKDMIPECQEDFPSETPKNVTPGDKEDLPPETSKDMILEGQKDLSSETANVTPEDQEDLLSETPKDVTCQGDLSSQTPKDITPECQKDLPFEMPKNVTLECQEDLSSEKPKDVMPECQEDLPSDTPEGQKDLSSIIPKDVAPEGQKDLSSETLKEVTEEQKDLSCETPKDVTQEGQKDLSSETSNDVTPENQNDLLTETPKDITPECQQEFIAHECHTEFSCDAPKEGDNSDSSNTPTVITNGFHNSGIADGTAVNEDEEDCLSDGTLEQLDTVLREEPSEVKQVSGAIGS